jgi:hypothetical protein
MKNLLTLLLSSLVLLAAPAAHACSCVKGGPFVQMAEKSDVVIRAKVLDYQWREHDPNHEYRPESMRLEVKTVYKGAVNANPLIVWGDNGIICRPYVTQFPIGTEWVFALRKDDGMEPVAPSQGQDDFAISACGEYWLQVQGEQVQGFITQIGDGVPPQFMSLSDLQAQLGDRTLPNPSKSDPNRDSSCFISVMRR